MSEEKEIINEDVTFKVYDLVIRESNDGDEYVAFDKGFNPTFVKSMKAKGVEKVIKRED